MFEKHSREHQKQIDAQYWEDKARYEAYWEPKNKQDVKH